jgi:hypothetical protein
MSQKRTRESPVFAPGPKSRRFQSLTMSHDETFMSHRETSDAAGNPPEIRRKIGNAREKTENGRKLRLRGRGETPIRAAWCARARKIAKLRAWAASAFSVPFPAAAGVPGPKARHSAAHGADRPAAGPRRKFRRHFPNSRRAPAPTPAGNVPDGTFLSLERTRLRRDEPELRLSASDSAICSQTTRLTAGAENAENL